MQITSADPVSGVSRRETDSKFRFNLPDSVARDAHDPLVLAEQVEGLDGLFSEAHDALGRGPQDVPPRFSSSDRRNLGGPETCHRASPSPTPSPRAASRLPVLVISACGTKRSPHR